MLSPDSWNWMQLNADTTKAEEKEKDFHAMLFMGVWHMT